MIDPDEQPALTPEHFARFETALKSGPPLAAIDALCESLKEVGDFNALFYARLMRKRVELGVSPFPTGPAADLPQSVHEAYESAIRDAARETGRHFLDRHDIRSAWYYFNMLGEPEPVREYLKNFTPTDADDIQPIIEIALYAGAAPEKGFDLVVEKYGICNSITTYSGFDFSKNPAAKQHAIRTLVRTLHQQLRERLVSDLEGRNVTVGDESITQLIESHPELFDEGAYHIDTSHLSSVSQFSIELEAAPERALARELCLYGSKLATTFQYEAGMPFEKTYADYLVYLKLLDGMDAESGLKHFESKIERGIGELNTLPAEVYVNLLLKLDRKPEAVAVAKKYLATENRPLTCPSVYELCRESNDFDGLAESARQRGDGIHFLAAKIAKQGGRSPISTPS